MRAIAIRCIRFACAGVVLLCAVGCGHGQAGAEASGQADVSAAASIEGISQDIERGVAGVLEPVDQADAVLDAIRTAPQRLSLDAESVAAALVAGLQGAPLVRADGSVMEDAAQAELQQLAQQLATVVVRLEETPKNVKALLSKVTTATLRIPRLAAEGQASAQVALNNPFANANEKQEARAEVDALTALPTRVLSQIKEAQARLMTLPQRAAKALTELASLVPSGETDLVTLARAAAPALAAGPSIKGNARVQVGGAAAATVRGSATTASRSVAPAPARPVAAATALDIVGPRLDRGTDTLVERFQQVDTFQADLRTAATRFRVPRPWLSIALVGTALGSPIAQPDGRPPAPELQAELTRLSTSMLRLIAELAATSGHADELAHAAEQSDVLLIRLVADVDAAGQAWLQSFRPKDAASQQAQLDRVVRLRANAAQAQREALTAVQRARSEAPTFGPRAAAALRALQRALPLTAIDLTALAVSRVPVPPLLEPLPPISAPPEPATSPGLAATVEASPYVPAPPAEDSREQVREALRGAKAGIVACAQGIPGTATASMKVSGPSGRVTAVEVTFDSEFERRLTPSPSTPIDRLRDYHVRCMSDVLFDMQLPQLPTAEISIVYPFVLAPGR